MKILKTKMAACVTDVQLSEDDIPGVKLVKEIEKLTRPEAVR